MLMIHLEQILFRSYHGLYEEERINGNDFLVDVTVKYQPFGEINRIEDTINYAEVFELVRKRMAIATPLLETVAMDIAALILSEFKIAEKVMITIKKLNPPIKNFNGKVGVSFELKR